MRLQVRRATCIGSVGATLWLTSCGGSSPLPAADPSAPSTAPRDASNAAQADRRRAEPAAIAPDADRRAPTATRAGAGASVDDDDDDPAEADDPATLEPLAAAGERLRFSKGTVSERECWQSVALTGEARRDYATLVEHCGKPTGAAEYAKPAIGKLDHRRDKRDTFIVFLRGGLCYRFFGVGDATIPELDILIERNGALQGENRTHGSVAIINTDKSWCMDSDGEYRFSVEVGGQGYGRYVFGVWARPGT